jgi:hypothetical protein
MGLPRTPLDAGKLSEGVKKVLSGPTPAKMMAARGLAPLKPSDLAVVLYQLSLETDENLAAAAAKTAGDLPEKVLAGALGDTALDPRVLDFFGTKVVQKPALVELVLLNRASADETIADMTAKLGEKEIEIVATNDERLLRCPQIIAAMYMNPRARMSTVDRAVELAVRNQVTVPGIAAWDEIVQAVLGLKGRPKTQIEKEKEDAAFAAVAKVAIGETPILGLATGQKGGELVEIDEEELERVNVEEEKVVEETKDKVPINELSIPAKIRMATLGNAFARAILIRDSNKQVALAAIRSPGVTDNEAVKFSANRALSDDVVRVIANTKEWTKLYQVKVNLLNNPKTPLPVAMKFLPFLHPKDLRNVSRSKGIPSALVQQARKLLATKSH